MAGELIGKTAFVTGSGRGLGKLMAEKLAEQGADVIIHDIDAAQPAKYGEYENLAAVEKDVARHGTRVMSVTGNIGDPEAVARMKAEIDAGFGEVHILVNCAGGDIGAAGGKPDPNNALDIPLADVRALTENNLIGTILVCQTFIPPMVKAGGGAVINIGSVAAHVGCSNGAIYATLKAAVVHYTRCLATELREAGVRVNAVSPGPAKTARFEATRVTDPDKMNSQKVSLDRYAEPGEIADAVAFLAGPRSKFVNGQLLRVDGGMSLYPG